MTHGTPLPAELSGDVQTRPITIDRSLFYLVGGYLAKLTDYEPLEQTGTLTVEQAREALGEMLWNFYQEVPPVITLPVGSIINYPSLTPPDGWLLCDGTEYERTEYPDLYDVMAALFIVDADHFVVPDMKANFALGGGDLIAAGNVGGAGLISLTVDNLPAHTHQQRASNGTNLLLANGATSSTVGLLPVAVTRNVADPQPLVTGSVGSGQSFSIMPPYVVLAYIIKAD